jgi:hypothetical protein
MTKSKGSFNIGAGVLSGQPASGTAHHCAVESERLASLCRMSAETSRTCC